MFDPVRVWEQLYQFDLSQSHNMNTRRLTAPWSSMRATVGSGTTQIPFFSGLERDRTLACRALEIHPSKVRGEAEGCIFDNLYRANSVQARQHFSATARANLRTSIQAPGCEYSIVRNRNNLLLSSRLSLELPALVLSSCETLLSCDE